MSFRLQSFIGDVMKRVNKEAEKRALGSVNILRNNLIQDMAQPHTGREYKVPGTGRTYTASAPGEYPAIRLGQLRAGIRTAASISPSGIFGVIGTDVEHGLYLEAGLRPWLGKEFEDSENELKDYLGKPWF